MALGPLGVMEKPDMGLWMPWRSLEYSVAETYGQWGPWREHVTVNIPWMFFYCGHGVELQQQTFHWGDLTLQTFNDRRKFRSQTSDSMDRWKAEQGRGREKRKIRREKSRRERVRRKKMEMREKVGKSRFTVFFPMICGSGGSKSRLAKAAGAEPAGQMRWKSARRCGAKHILKSKCTKHTILGPLLEVEMSKKCTPLWREAHFQVKMYKTPQLRTAFGSWDVAKVHAVVARSTFRSQNVKNTRGFGPLLEVQISKKCTPLWREAHFEVNMLKTPGVRTTLGGSDVASRGRRKGLCTLSKVSKTWGYCSIFNYNHHYTRLHSNTLHYTTTTTTTTPSLHSTTLHSTTLHCTQLHSITLHNTTLHYTTLHHTTLHYTTYTTLPSTTLHYITLHYTPLRYNYNYSTTLNYTPLD